MNDEYLYLWAQWGILNYEQYQFVLTRFENLEKAWKEITPTFLKELGMRSDKIERVFEFRERLSFHEMVRKIEALKIQILSVEDDAYPASLKTIHDPPVFFVCTR